MDLYGFMILPNISKEQKKEIDSKVKLFIGIPHNFDEMKNEFRVCMDRMKAFIGGQWHLNSQGYDSYVNDNGWVIHYEPAYQIEIARNNICNLALDNGFTHVLMIDSDMMFNFDLPYKLLLHDKDCVAPLMKVRYPDENMFFRYAHFSLVDGKSKPCLFTEAFKGLTEDPTYYSGTGCILLKTEILNKIKYPYFHTEIIYFSKTEVSTTGEDCYFGMQLVKNGITTCIDTDIIIGHLAVFPVPFEMYYLNSTGLNLNYRKEELINASNKT